MGQLDGKVALITGAGRGIGRGIARAMAREGAAVAVQELDAERAREAADEVAALSPLGAIAIGGDIGTRAVCERAVAETVEAFGGLDILVNNAAGNAPRAPLVELEDEVFDLSWRVCVMGTVWCMQAAHPHLVARGGGSIINFGSASATAGRPTQAAYSAAKEGVRALTRVAANEWGEAGITVNTICPFAASEGMLAWAENQPGGVEAATAHIPLRRLGDPEHDVGRIAVFLASDAARYVTAQTMWVDGGSGMVRS